MSITQNVISDISAVEWSLPLVAPFRVATRTSTVGRNILVKITASNGTFGIGACAPVEYITGESQQSVLASLSEIGPIIAGQDINQLLPVISILEELLPSQPSARAGAEMAYYDLWAKSWGIPLWHYFGGSETVLSTDITIPIVPADEAEKLVKDAASEGFRVFKIKIGDSDGHDADLARIAAVTGAAPGCSLRIDANQAFTPDAAVAFVKSAQKICPLIELVEQPVPKEDYDGLKYVKDHIELPVIADESARSYTDVKKLIQMGAVDGINIKLMKSGIRESAEIACLCKRSGIRLMVGCMLESPLGIAAAASIAAGIGGFDYIDLDSHRLLKPVECLQGEFKAVGPQLIVNSTSAGWGIDIIDCNPGTQASH